MGRLPLVSPKHPSDWCCRCHDCEGSIDAAVLDINLGGGPAFEIARDLNGRQVPFLFATGYDSAAIPDDLERAPRLEKPFGGPALVTAVSRLRAPQ